MFVASVDRSDPNKNTIYQIGPDGTLLGVFVNFTDGLSGAEAQHQPDRRSWSRRPSTSSSSAA